MENLDLGLVEQYEHFRKAHRLVGEVSEDQARQIAELLGPKKATERSFATLSLAECRTPEAVELLYGRGYPWQRFITSAAVPNEVSAPRVLIDERVLLAMSCYLKLMTQMEVACSLMVSRSMDGAVLRVTSVSVFPCQIVQPATVVYPVALGHLLPFIAREEGLSVEQARAHFRGDFHSHVDMAASPSPPDITTLICRAAGLFDHLTFEPDANPPVRWLSLIGNRRGDLLIHYLDLEQQVYFANLPWELGERLSPEENPVRWVQQMLPVLCAEMGAKLTLPPTPNKGVRVTKCDLAPEEAQDEWDVPAAKYGEKDLSQVVAYTELPPETPEVQAEPTPPDQTEDARPVEVQPQNGQTSPEPVAAVSAEPKGFRLPKLTAFAALLVCGLAIAYFWQPQKETMPQIDNTPRIVASTAPVQPEVAVKPEPKPVQNPDPVTPAIAVQPPATPPAPEPVPEEKPVVAVVEPPVAPIADTPPEAEPETSPVVAATVSEPAPVVEETKTLEQELVERFKDVKEPDRIWPDPKLFAGVSLAELKMFGAMTIEEFEIWSIANPEKMRRVNRIIPQTFDGMAKASIPAGYCRACTSGAPEEYCESVDATGLSQMCQEGAIYLGRAEKPLRKVLEVRLKGNK